MINIKYLTDYEKQIRFVARYGLSANDKCLCGSGKAYENCCWRMYTLKDEQEVLSWISVVLNNTLSKTDHKNITCLFKTCESRAIKSHLFSKGTHIKYITGNHRQVRRYTKSMRNGKSITLNQRLQRKETSTFRGFCSVHDNGLFNAIDNNFEFIDNKLYALSYRCIGYHLRKLETTIRVFNSKLFKEVPMYYSNRVVDLAERLV